MRAVSVVEDSVSLITANLNSLGSLVFSVRAARRDPDSLFVSHSRHSLVAKVVQVVKQIPPARVRKLETVLQKPISCLPKSKHMCSLHSAKDHRMRPLSSNCSGSMYTSVDDSTVMTPCI